MKLIKFSERVVLSLNKIKISQFYYFFKPSKFDTSPKILNLILSYFFKTKEGFCFLVKDDNGSSYNNLLNRFKEIGFIETFHKISQYNDYPKLLYFYIKFYLDKDNLGEKRKHHSFSSVFVEDGYDLAFMKSFGEALERHVQLYDFKNKKTFYPKVFKKDCSFLFDLLPKFTNLQIEKNKNLLSSKEDLISVDCIKVKSIINNKGVFLPFDCFYYGEKINKKIIFESTTNGSGGGFKIEEALLSSLYENIERDSFLLYWFSGIKPDIIDVNGLENEFGKYLLNVKNTYKLDVFFLDLVYDINIPVCVCVIIDPVLNLVAMGGKACFSGIDSLKYSFSEALSVLVSARNIKEKNNTPFYYSDNMSAEFGLNPFCSNLNKGGRIALFNSKDGVDEIKKFFLSGDDVSFYDYNSRSLSFKDKSKELLHVIELFRGLKEKKGGGYDVYMHKFDSVWLRKCDYCVVKTFIPSFLKLHLSENLATPVSHRLVEFAKEKGKIINNEEGINPLPHFFP